MSRIKQENNFDHSSSDEDKKPKEKKELPDNEQIVVDDDELDDSELLHPTIFNSDYEDDWFADFEPTVSSLIWSSSDRAALIVEQDNDFQLSQAADLVKMQQAEEESLRR